MLSVLGKHLYLLGDLELVKKYSVLVVGLSFLIQVHFVSPDNDD